MLVVVSAALLAVGLNQVTSCATSVTVYSAGFLVGDFAQIAINGCDQFRKEIGANQNRGLDVVVLSGGSSEVRATKKCFAIIGGVLRSSCCASGQGQRHV
jgi:hypothetical protein